MDNLSMIALNGDDASAIASPVTVTISQAGLDHLAGSWSADSKTKSCHEAGHSVASALLGLPLSAVTIKPTRGGHVELGIEDDDHPQFRSNSAVQAEIVVSLAGLAAEIELLGEGSLGSESDIAHATALEISRLASGLDPDFPPVSTNAWAFSAIPAVLGDLQATLVIAHLTEARAKAQELISAHREQVLAFAVLLFRARRLDGVALDSALRSVGLEPAPRGVAFG